MNLTESAIVRRLGTQVAYLDERQKLLAQNIAHIDSPDYRAKDLKKLDFHNLAASEANQLPLRATSASHLEGRPPESSFRSEKLRKAFDKKPLGNNVELEEQMGKISDVGAQHQMATTLLKKFNQLYRTAVDNKGS